jgi:hypothetical protein
MNYKSYKIILGRQFKEKWGRILLASGGIMVGVWAITLTSSLSLGLSDTIVTAINSQSFAKQITLTKTEGNQTNLFDISDAPQFVPIGFEELKEVEESNPNIQAVGINNIIGFYVHTDQANENTSCVDWSRQLQPNPAQESPNQEPQGVNIETQPEPGNTPQPQSPDEIEDNVNKLQEECNQSTAMTNSFPLFYESNRTRWVGPAEKPGREEIVVCYECGSENLGEKLGYDNPEDLVGQEITIEFSRAPDLFPKDKPIDVTNLERQNAAITESEPIKFTVAAVVDDRDTGVFGLPSYYFDEYYYKEAFSLANPDVSVDDYGSAENDVFVDSYDNLNSVMDQLRDEGYLVFSLAQTIISGVETAFLGLTVILGLFGLIALVASLFGIVNVMTISVLERKKEIGILKSLGAKDQDIFNIFFIESTLLGILGWLMGTLLAGGMGLGIGLLSQYLIESNEQWRDNLQALNIEQFTPAFPWWILLGTFVLAVSFTAVSGLIPAIRASKQNPVEVLRSE